MALTVEDGTGLLGADAYESAEDTAARLTALGVFRFAQRGPASREGIIRQETQETDAFLSQWVSGDLRIDRQGLLFPRGDAFRRDDREIETGELPRELLDGIALRCEANAARRWAQCNAQEGSPPAASLTFFESSPDAYRRFLNLMDVQRG